MQFIVVFCVAHRAFGSLIIAGVRILYIKFHHVLLRVGICRFVTCAKWLGFSISLILASGQAAETFFFREPPGGMVFYAFFADLNPDMEEFQAVFDHLCTTFSLLANLLEFIFFCVIMRELVRLNRGAAALFSSSRRNVAMKRARKNAITGTGHFISWLIEFLLFGICQSIVTAAKDKLGLTQFIFFMLWPSINYVVFPTVQTLSSDELRTNAFGCMQSGCTVGSFQFSCGVPFSMGCLKCKCSCGMDLSEVKAQCGCCGGTTVEGDVAASGEQMEMKDTKDNVSPV